MKTAKRIVACLLTIMVILATGASMIAFANVENNSIEDFSAGLVKAEYHDDYTVKVTFDSDISLADDAKGKIQKYGYYSMSLAEEDNVSASGCVVTVSMSSANYMNKNMSKIIFNAGALLDSNGIANSAVIEAEIGAREKRISKVTYSTESLPSSGGAVSVVVEGENLNNEGFLNGKVYLSDVSGDVYQKSIRVDYNEQTCTFSFTLPDNSGTEDKHYKLKFQKSNWDATPVEVQEGGNTIVTVAGRTTALDPVITEMTYSKTRFKSMGGEVTVNIKGSALTLLTSSDFSISLNGEEVSVSDISIVYSAGTDSSATASFVLPENSSYEKKVYSFEAKKGADSLDNNPQDITVLAINDNPLVESITYDMNSSDLHGGSSIWNTGSNLKLSMTGDNLDKLSKNDFKFELDGHEVNNVEVAINTTDSHNALVVLSFPANEVEEELIYKISVLCAEEGTANAVKSIPIDAKPQDKTDKFEISNDKWNASTVGEGVIKVHIDEPDAINLRVTEDDYNFYIDYVNDYINQLKDYIFFAASDTKPYNGVVNLSDGDKVTLEHNSSGTDIIITLANKETRIPAYIVFRTDSLRRAEGNAIKVLGNNEFDRDHSRYINQNSHIDSITYNKITFDSRGGELIATIKGNKLNESSPGLWAKVFVDSEKDYRTETGLTPSVVVNDDGTEATISLNLPRNDTARTISYRLIPVLNGTNSVPLYINGYDVISVLPAGASEDDITLSSVEVQGAYDMDDMLEVFKTSTTAEQFTSKVDVIIRGTNLSSKKTLIKAVDENGVTWPMLPVYECGATIRWQNSAYYLPEKASKNEQHIELLLPRRLGVPHTFTIYLAPDGKNYLDNPTATVIIDNNGLFDRTDMANRGFVEEDFTELSSLRVQYVDENGRELAPSDTFKGYGITELYHLGIVAKDIPGYKVVKTYPLNLSSMIKQPVQHSSGEYIFEEGQYYIATLSGKPIRYIYKAVDSVEKGMSLESVEKYLTETNSDKDPKGSTFAPLMLRSTKQSKNSISLKWKSVSGAKKYVIYGNNCGKKLQKICTSGKKSYKVTKIGKKLKKGKYYKFVAVALDKNNKVVSVSKVIHVTTKGGKKANPKMVTSKAKKNKVSIKKNKTFKLAGKYVLQDKKKGVKKQVGVRYESSNTSVASVNNKGVIKAKSKGKCKIYVYAQNGVYKVISVIVK